MSSIPLSFLFNMTSQDHSEEIRGPGKQEFLLDEYSGMFTLITGRG